jgi:serpin B
MNPARTRPYLPHLDVLEGRCLPATGLVPGVLSLAPFPATPAPVHEHLAATARHAALTPVWVRGPDGVFSLPSPVRLVIHSPAGLARAFGLSQQAHSPALQRNLVKQVEHLLGVSHINWHKQKVVLDSNGGQGSSGAGITLRVGGRSIHWDLGTPASGTAAVAQPAATVPTQPAASPGGTGGSGTPAVEPTLPDTPAEAIDRFAADLYAQLVAQPGNLAFSPFSIETALAMTYAGAGGQTAAEMAKVLHLGDNTAATHTAYGALVQQILADGNAAGSELDNADALWGQQGYPFAPDFLQTLQSAYGSEIHSLDFQGAPEQARGTINDWVAQQTNNKILDLLPPGFVTNDTRLVLTNALYFNGDWAHAFDANDTQDGTFTVAPGQTVKAPLMHQTADFLFGHQDGVETLEMPYAGGHLAMDVLLPDQTDGLGALEAQLTPEHLAQWTAGLSEQAVDVTLPKFQVTGRFSLKNALSALGMPTAFSDAADFSGMNGGTEALKIDGVVHQAYVAVGEKGTEAAAATGVGASPTAIAFNPQPPVVFRADHPFVYLIRDTSTNAVLFLGRVTDPSQT